MDLDQYCFGCLTRKEENSIYCVNLENSALKIAIQVDKLFLCYLCKRASQQAELFVQNVQSNQMLLENVINLAEPESLLQSSRTQIRPIHELTLISLYSLEIGFNDSSQEESSSVTVNSWVKVKEELKEEDNGLDDDYVDDDNDFPGLFVKDEDFPLKALLKKEVEVEVIDLKRLKKSRKRGKHKKNKGKHAQHDDIQVKTEPEVACNIETVFITREQCLEERARKALDRRYVESTHKCEDCLKGFNFKESYDKHMEKHNASNGDYECDVCKQRMSSEDKLISHKRYHEVRYRCSVCGLTRVSRVTVQDHYYAFHTVCKHSCPHCAKSFKRRVSWRKHISNVHTHRRVTCAYCNKSYANKDVLKAHMIVQHPAQEAAGPARRGHVCAECGKAFRAPSQLKIHSTKHSPTRDYYCVECNKSFKSASILKHHLKTASTHVSYTELPLPCEHCDKRFAIRRDLDRHTNRVHLNIKPFQCDQCDKAYVNGWSLNEHKRLVHEGFKRPLKYPCPMCDKVFDRNQVLKGHIRTHTGERPYQCARCPAQFSQASILGTHVRLVHLRLTRDGRPKPVPAK